MKNNKRAIFAALMVGLLALGSSPASALSESQTASLTKILATVPPVELAPRSIQLVNSAAKADKLDTALVIVRTVAKRNPGAAVSVFSAITVVAPELTSKLAVAVVELLPDKAGAVARIATQNDPKDSPMIIADLIRVAPAQTDRVLQEANTGKSIALTSTQNDAISRSTRLVNDNTTRSFPPGQTGTIKQSTNTIDIHRTFPGNQPHDVSDYAAPGEDPNR
jgi:hypothetical protein